LHCHQLPKKKREIMTNPLPKETGIILQKNRIEALTDGFFAIAMTLLATEMNIPKLGDIVTAGTVDSIISSIFPDIIHYVIAFALLANFWWASHIRSHYLTTMSRRMSGLNIVTLLFVGLIPFSTKLATSYPMNTQAVMMFEFNLFVLGLLSVLEWNQIARDTGSDAGTGSREVSQGWKEACIFPVLSAMAIVFALFSVPGGIFMYFIAPVYFVLLWVREKHLQMIQNAVSPAHPLSPDKDRPGVRLRLKEFLRPGERPGNYYQKFRRFGARYRDSLRLPRLGTLLPEYPHSMFRPVFIWNHGDEMRLFFGLSL
jgi:uncharacterized membrane protein